MQERISEEDEIPLLEEVAEKSLDKKAVATARFSDRCDSARDESAASFKNWSSKRKNSKGGSQQRSTEITLGNLGQTTNIGFPSQAYKVGKIGP